MLNGLIDLFFPALCPLCNAHGPALCPACRQRLQPLPDPCKRCGAPGGAKGCRHCRDRGLPWIDRVHVGWPYADGIRDLITRAKAGAEPAAIVALAHLLPCPDGSWDTVVPIPSAPGRRPGPHLASALARRAARHLDRPCRRLLRLTRMNAEQHRLDRSARQRNVAGLYRSRATRGRVLLVDDLLTTGATLSAAAKALRQAGARSVTALVLARTTVGGVSTTDQGATEQPYTDDTLASGTLAPLG